MREYGQAPNALLESVSQLTDDINDHHQLDLVLDVAKDDSSTQDNLEKHLSQLDISQPDVPEANREKHFQPRYPSLKDMTEDESEITDSSSTNPSAPTELLDIDPMEELMQSNYINLLHNPEVVSDVNNTTTNPNDTADTVDTAATSNPRNWQCYTTRGSD